MKKTKNLLLLFSLVLMQVITTVKAQIPTTETAFRNSANFPVIPGDVMVPSQSNYYHPNIYASPIPVTGGTIDGQNLIMMYFTLFSNLKLSDTNPFTYTNSTTYTLDYKNRRIAGATTYPFFNRYALTDNETFIWPGYPFRPGFSAAQMYNLQRLPEWNIDKALVDKKYKDNEPFDDYNSYYYKGTLGESKKYILDLKTTSAEAVKVYSRINTLRDKLVLHIWTGRFNLNGDRQSPLTDLRIQNWDPNSAITYKLWFNGVGNTDVTPTVANGGTTEFQKIALANSSYKSAVNTMNGPLGVGKGEDVRNFNRRFETITNGMTQDRITAGTEAAMEMAGKRTLDFQNDVDNYGALSKTINISFRILTAGGRTRAADFTNPTAFHPNNPYALTQTNYLDIIITRPAIKFLAADASATSAYIGKPIVMDKGAAGINTINLDITEQNGALLPYTEIETNPLIPGIDFSRVRVSLIKKSDYEAAVTTASSIAGYDALNNPMPNNDLPTIADFAYLTQANFLANQTNIPIGQYYIKYDYSSPDSNTDIKTDGDKLGNVFAKSVYRLLTVNGKEAWAYVNPNLRFRVENPKSVGCPASDKSQTIDSDGDGITDACDADSDNDGIMDAVEDLNHNGKFEDDDTEGDILVTPVLGDGVSAYLDLDSDNDGILDLYESGIPMSIINAIDANHDGIVDVGVAVGSNGLADILETFPDSGISKYALANTDCDDKPDFLDLTSNGTDYDLYAIGKDYLDDLGAGYISRINDGDKDGIQAVVDTDPIKRGAPGSPPSPYQNTTNQSLDSNNDGILDNCVPGTGTGEN
ncbi:thrombospondin type 3 repeat-containing protein [Pedobacter punctiformis]|uniref:Thrombospondin type 3 repeat-containing protein n=1 Tax=Pedobacter punctiformis TaxID=3004097 RepID=A0ABT4LBP2_9SPHI|nr:thrombospondin type 3 repeat-containing protein [Pedobacter sp. HCMS5-2]MCZ4245132.1 thrombospondin type 3 repeat-containing protein [Pedobacter sp. HCMS5-2]